MFSYKVSDKGKDAEEDDDVEDDIPGRRETAKGPEDYEYGNVIDDEGVG